MNPQHQIQATYEQIHPALDFTSDHAYVGQHLHCRENRDASGTALFLISDNQERIPTDENSLRERGLTLQFSPFTSEPRWTFGSIQHFIEEGSAIAPDELLCRVKNPITRYIELADERLYDFFSLWIIGTYFFPLFNSYPYVYVGGVSGSGKTKLLSACQALSFNSIFSGNMSTAVIYRLIQNRRCSLFIDETDNLANRQISGDFRRILLNGYKKGLNAWRNRSIDGDWVPESFEVYGPKILANIEGIENVLESRCIPVVMRRGLNREITNREISFTDTTWQQIRDLIYPFLLTKWQAVREIYSEIENETVLSGRNWELWKPILSLAMFLGESELLERMSELALDKVAETDSFRFDNHEIVLAETLLTLVEEDNYYSLDLIRNRLAREFNNDDWLTCRKVGRLLRRLGFSSSRRVGSGTQFFLRVPEVRDVASSLGISVVSEDSEHSEDTTEQAEEQSSIVEPEEVIS